MMDQNSFFSVDRLVEFGMNMTMANQIIKTMNESMSGMFTSPLNPGGGNPALAAAAAGPSRVYYASLDGKQAGPFSETEVVQLINSKKLSRETLVWYPGLKEWTRAENVPEILRLVALMPPPLTV